jgi:hypothetical protein
LPGNLADLILIGKPDVAIWAGSDPPRAAAATGSGGGELRDGIGRGVDLADIPVVNPAEPKVAISARRNPIDAVAVWDRELGNFGNAR